MSKYGPGVSMKQMMLMEMENVNKILDKSNLSAADKKEVTDALKEAFYQWASCNASFRQFEDLVTQTFGREKILELYRQSIANVYFFKKKMSETYPQEWGEEEEIAGEEK